MFPPFHPGASWLHPKVLWSPPPRSLWSEWKRILDPRVGGAGAEHRQTAINTTSLSTFLASWRRLEFKVKSLLNFPLNLSWALKGFCCCRELNLLDFVFVGVGRIQFSDQIGNWSFFRSCTYMPRYKVIGEDTKIQCNWQNYWNRIKLIDPKHAMQ